MSHGYPLLVLYSYLSVNHARTRGCCAICHKTPCTPLIKCSGKKCKNWVHFDCDSLVGDKGDLVDIYYCAPCRKRYPKSRGVVTYFDINDSYEQDNINSIVQNIVYEMLDIVTTPNDAVDYIALINSNSSIQNYEHYSKLDYLFDDSFDAPSISQESLPSDLDSSTPSVIISNDGDVLRESVVIESENNETSKKQNQVPSTDQNFAINKLNVRYNKDIVSSTPAKHLAEGEVTEKTQ